MMDNALLFAAIRHGIEDSGATLCDKHSRQLDPIGAAAVYLLSGSRVSVHTYPDCGSLSIDAFTCGNRRRPDPIVESLVDTLGPCGHGITVVGRGIPIRSAARLGVAE